MEMMRMMKKTILESRLFFTSAAISLSLTATAYAAAPGIKGTSFNLTAKADFINQPDGQSVYSWGYGCTGNKPDPATFAPAAITSGFCNDMQIPGPTLIVTEGESITVTLTNSLPPSAGNTSILFPGFNVTTSCAAMPPAGQQGLLTCEATPGSSVTYTFTASSPGTRSYYSGTQGDLQVEMGLFGAVIVLPANVPATCSNGLPESNPGNNARARANWGESDFRLAPAAYDIPQSCYDREYLFQFSEMDPRIHQAAEEQVAAAGNCIAGAPGCNLNVPTEPYHPAYFMINGRSMPDDMDSNYAAEYPHQPYNGDPHVHPGEQLLLRIIGQGRWQHPFHEHANHVRILARDGNLILTPDGVGLAGPAFFTTTTTPGQAMDGIFYYTGRGLNWDMYGHHPGDTTDSNASLSCIPDANGYNTGAPTAINYFEWCQDHNKPLEVAPFGDVGGNGPATLPEPNILTNGTWYGGSPYLGPDATVRAVGVTGTTPPAGTVVNGPSGEAGYAFMWHSHNEREITTNNVFPGGMFMMLLVDSREFVIDETN